MYFMLGWVGLITIDEMEREMEMEMEFLREEGREEMLPSIGVEFWVSFCY